AAGASIYSINGVEFVAITVGGTTTSSNGGTVASQLQVFNIGGSQKQSTGPTFSTMKRSSVVVTHKAAAPTHVAASAGAARIVPPASVAIQPWDPNTNNTQDVQGRLLLGGKPVA